jgi:nucleoside-diphosphate-sugar epimerase
MIPHDLHHFFVGQHVFVTGASGFIGGHVASLLIQAGAHVRAFTRSRKGGYDSAIDWVEGDLLARDSIERSDEGLPIRFSCRGGLSVLGAQSA